MRMHTHISHYMCICVYMHAYMHTYIYTFVYIYIYQPPRFARFFRTIGTNSLKAHPELNNKLPIDTIQHDGAPLYKGNTTCSHTRILNDQES